jgi:small subunit ribosomal protein S24e
MIMDIEILKKEPEPLMKRTLFQAKMVFEGKTPSRIDIKKDLCHKLGSKEAMTIVRKITTDYGTERALLNGYYYDDEAVMKKIENRYVILRHLTKGERNAEKEKVKAAKQAAAPTAGGKKKK